MEDSRFMQGQLSGNGRTTLILVSRNTMQPLNLANLCKTQNQCSDTDPDLHSKIIAALNGLPKPTDDQFVPKVMDLLHEFSTSMNHLHRLAHHLAAALTEENQKSIRIMTTGTRATRMRDNIKLQALSKGVPSDEDMEFVRFLRETCAAIFLLQVEFRKIDKVGDLTAQLRTSRVDNKRVFRAPSPGVNVEYSAPSSQSLSQDRTPVSMDNTSTIEDQHSGQQSGASGSMFTRQITQPGPEASSPKEEVKAFMEGYRKFSPAYTANTMPRDEGGLLVAIAALYEAVLDNSRYDDYWDAASQPRKWLEGTHGFPFRAELQVRSVVRHFAPASYQAYMASKVSIDKTPGSLPDAEAMAKLEHSLRVLHELVYETGQLDASVRESDRTASSIDQQTVSGTSVGETSHVTGTTNSAPFKSD
jgi:hypothetical protein